MTIITARTRSMTAIVGVIASGSCFVLPMLISWKAARPATRAAFVTKQPSSASAAAFVASPKPVLTNLSGKWGGSGVLPRRGSCQLGIDFERTEDGGYIAYTVTNCIPFLPAQPSLNPSFAVLEGTVGDGALQMRARKTLVGPATQKGCVMSDLSVAAWTSADDSVIAEWRDSCSGGQMKLQRVK